MGCGRGGRRGLWRPLLPPEPTDRVSRMDAKRPVKELDPGDPDDEEDTLLPVESVILSMSSKPALVWKRLLRLTTLGDVCVLSVHAPTQHRK